MSRKGSDSGDLHREEEREDGQRQRAGTEAREGSEVRGSEDHGRHRRDGSPSAYGASSWRPAVDYLEREAENRSLGRAGELFVVAFERARLIAAGEDRLAARIEHVAATRGDGDGFDILSFEASGRERLIEVKTTKYGSQTPFAVTANEVRVSEREADSCQLYRVCGFRKAPRLFAVPGAVSSGISLSPTQFLARIS